MKLEPQEREVKNLKQGLGCNKKKYFFRLRIYQQIRAKITCCSNNKLQEGRPSFITICATQMKIMETYSAKFMHYIYLMISVVPCSNKKTKLITVTQESVNRAQFECLQWSRHGINLYSKTYNTSLGALMYQQPWTIALNS